MSQCASRSIGTTRCRTLLTAILAAALLSSAAYGQDEDDRPDFEDITLETQDGVFIRCTYYHGDNGKETVPIILLHDWEGRRGEFHNFALALQGLKHAVIVPDLRGHGRSTRRRNPRPGGEDLEIDRDRMNRDDIAAMVRDVEAVKSFLMERNNAGELNIEQLCVVGSGMGALIAMNWALVDWTWPQLPTIKQGRDVKALVLISPRQSFKGVTAQDALQHPAIRGGMSIFLAAGAENSRAMSDARRLHRTFERFHTDEEEQDLIFLTPDTSLQGTRLLAAPGLNVGRAIAIFINERLVKRSDRFPWRDRTNPLDR